MIAPGRPPGRTQPPHALRARRGCPFLQPPPHPLPPPRTNLQVQKHIKILENRLDKALQRYNEAVAHNRSLRHSIDDLRRERLVFEGIYKKLEKELGEKKKELANITEVAEKAAEARDTAVAELARLKTQAEKEQAAFEAEWRELGRMIENDRRMRDMLKAKRLSKLAAAANSAPLLKPSSAPSGDDKVRA